MALLCTFVRILVRGIAWEALFLGLLESDSATRARASDFASPESVRARVLFAGKASGERQQSCSNIAPDAQ